MDQKILREYLIALGFQIDQRGEKKVDSLLGRMDKKALGLGKTLVGLATTVVTATTVFARQMEKMYYSARYADTTVASLQALEYGARSIGLEAGRGSAALKNMASAIRSNPGLIGLLNSLGVEVKGRDKADVLTDLVAKLKEMPFYVAERFAGLFGIDQETLFNLEQGLDKMKEAQEARRQMALEMGVDSDQAAETAKTYMGMWREVTERAKLFGQVLGEAAMPYVEKLVKETNQLMIEWSGVVRELREIDRDKQDGFKKRFVEGITGVAQGDRVELSKQAKERLGAPEKDLPPVAPSVENPSFTSGGQFRFGAKLVQQWERFRDRHLGKLAPRVAKDPDAVDAATDDSDFKPKKEMSEQERVRLTKLALAGGHTPIVLAKRGDQDAGDTSPGGTDMSIEEFERLQKQALLRRGGPFLARQDAGDTSPGGSDQGGFDPKEFLAGLEKKYNIPSGVLGKIWKRESNEGDPKYMRSPKGAMGHFGFMPATAKEYGVKDPDDFQDSAQGAAHKMGDLLKQYHGDLRMAAAAYNWGDGNLQRYGLNRAPEETRKYVADVAGGQTPVNITANPEIHIHGVHDPQQAADRVLDQQRTTNADIVRNFSPKVR